MKFKTIHLVGFGYLLDENGSFLFQEGELTRIQTANWSFLGKVQVVNSYYHNWFEVSQLGLMSEFDKNLIVRLEPCELDKIVVSKNRKINQVIHVINAIRDDFGKIYKGFECEDLFYLFQSFFKIPMAEELQKMIYNYSPNVGWFKMSIFLKL